MNNIFLKTTLPLVFNSISDITSDIWNKDISFKKGMTYLVEANSGTGKSSLFSYIFGYRNDFSGNIYFDTENVSDFSKSKWTNLRNHNIALMWQELRLFPELTAIENVLIKNNITNFQSMSIIQDWFEIMGIDNKMNTLVSKMSYGQQQRVAFIRTLCQPFDFILLDEPVSHLDDSNSIIMSDILMKEAKRQDAAIIVSSIGKRLDLNYNQIYRL